MTLKKKISKRLPDDTYLRVNIKLADDCKNGHEDFSITGEHSLDSSFIDSDIISCGCIHETILEHMPELKLFVDLHLSDSTGTPLYAVENGYYHLKNSSPQVVKNYLRLDNNQFNKIKDAGDIEHFHYLIETHLLEQWKREAEEGIRLLENLTGKKYDKEKTTRYTPLSKDKKKLIEKRIKEGYYKPERIQERERQEAEAMKKLKILDLQEKYRKKREEQNTEFEIKKWCLENEIELDDMIYYPSKDIVVIGWREYKKIPLETLKRYKKTLQHAPFNYEFNKKMEVSY